MGVRMTIAVPGAAREQPIVVAALAVAAVGVAVILGAFYFQYVLNYLPCPLCYEQRIPYYIAIPIGLAVAAGAWLGAPRWLLVTGLALMAAALLWNAGLATYHAGIEWKWWEGPKDCSAPMTSLGGAGGLMGQLQNINVVRCDEAAWRFLGLSLAGWNVPISLGLAGVAAWGIIAARRSGPA
jgi:disulfide bond formation protein DsbB